MEERLLEKQRMVGNPNQLIKARRIAFREGRAKDVHAIEILNESGLYATCIEDQCLNLYDFSYKGVNFAFQSKHGLSSRDFFNGGSNEFSYYWPAGMMYTCGLTNTGPGATEGGIYYAEHGRVGMMPAEDVTIEKTEDTVIITGTMHDAFLCGHHLELKRRIVFPIQGKEIQIYDQITNREAIPAELMFLYHFNFGYPLLAPGARVVKKVGTMQNLIDIENKVPIDWYKVSTPEDHKTEELYCHRDTPDEEGFGCAALFNEEQRLGCYIKYKLDTLPLMIHWKNMCAHDYCVGLEPSNTYIMGRTRERENGTLPVLGPYETREFQVKIGVLDGLIEMGEFESRLTSEIHNGKA